ncbi:MULTISPECIES: hypothetical protein [Rhodopseudomonas]|uniref:hypothetical protein n=1 Tax=Rhodopseudomonas TaxID=1073 RepID=UPI000E28447E|nr:MULTISPECIES: hypothetical protein [Rhodopseudomonas]
MGGLEDAASILFSHPTGISALVAALIGAMTSSIIAILHQRAVLRRVTMQEIIDDFLRPEFLVHRAVVSSLSRKVRRRDVEISEIARGYWYPGPKDGKRSYQGDKIDSLNEHQHLEIFIGYISRLAHRIRTEKVDRLQLRQRLRSAYRYHGPFMNSLAKEVRRQMMLDGETEIPSWVCDVEQVRGVLGVEDFIEAHI